MSSLTPPLRPFFFFFNDPAPTEIYTLSLHGALPICSRVPVLRPPRTAPRPRPAAAGSGCRSEEHTSELQSHSDLVCRLLLEKKKTTTAEVMIFLPRHNPCHPP